MIPILYPADATSFTTYGIGALKDAKKCIVIEERNGQYELEMTYYMVGQYYSEIQNERIILATPYPGGTPQAFCIYSITDNLDGTVEIRASHISYRANYIPIAPFSAEGVSNTIAGLAENALETCPFTITSDIVNTSTRYELLYPRSLRACLGGEEGSFLDRFGSKGTCEFEWDNFNIIAHLHRGEDRGYTVRYGKNLTDFLKETDSSELVTGCLAYWTDFETGNCYYSDIQYSSIYDTYPVKKTVTVDATDEFYYAPTREELNAFALNYLTDLTELKETTEVELYDDSYTPLKLCDTIHIIYEIKNGTIPIKTITYDAKVVRTEYDVLLDKYSKVTIGDAKSDLASTLVEKSEEAAANAINAVNSRMVSVYQHVDKEIGEATTAISAINGATISNLVDIITYYYISDSNTPPDKYDPNWIAMEYQADYIDVYGAPEYGKSMFGMYEYVYNVGYSRRTEPFGLAEPYNLLHLTTEYYLSSSSSEPKDSTWSPNKSFVPGYFTWAAQLCYYDEDIPFRTQQLTVVSVGDINKVTTNQQTQIDQNTEQISLSVTTEDVQKIVYEQDRVNYSPYFSRTYEDVNDGHFGWASDDTEITEEEHEEDPDNSIWKWIPGTTNPNGYWYITPSDSIEIGSGYAYFVLDGSEEPVTAHIVVNNDDRVDLNDLTLLLEIEDLEFGESESEIQNEVLFSIDSSYQFQTAHPESSYIYANYGKTTAYTNSITENGLIRIPVTKINDGEDNKIALTIFSFSVDEGISASFSARLSIFKNNYTEGYYSYNGSYLDINGEFKVVNELISTLSSSLSVTNSGLESVSEKIETTKQTIDEEISNAIKEATQTITGQYKSYMAQDPQGWHNEISRVAEIVNKQGEVIDRYQDYITIDTTIDGITIGKSDSDIRGKFDNDSLDFIDQNDNVVAWLAAEDGLGANFLSVGSGTDRSLRWNILVSSDGNSLRFARHE